MSKLNLLTVDWIEHIRNGHILWRGENLKNVLHEDGEEYIVTAAFVPGDIVPDNFYLGLDARPTVVVSDQLADLVSEPSTNGYSRQAIDSTDGFTIAVNDGGYFEATTAIVGFAAGGGSWGPVKNLFLSTTQNNDGYLIATVALTSDLTLSDGDYVSMRMKIALRDGT